MKLNNNILSELKELEGKLLLQSTKNPYTIPEDYFVGFAELLLSINNQSFTDPILSIDQQYKQIHPFEIPSNYFESLADEIFSQVKFENVEDPIPSFGKETKGFDIPNNYFDNFSEQMLAKVKAVSQEAMSASEEIVEDENELIDAPILSKIKSQQLANPFTLPEQFEFNFELPKVATKVIAFEPKISDTDINTNKKKFLYSNWVAAAAIIFIFVLGIGIVDDGQGNKSLGNTMKASAGQMAEMKLKTISDEAISQYINQHADEFDVYSLESTVGQNANEAPASSSSDSFLDNISDEDIEAYIDSY